MIDVLNLMEQGKIKDGARISFYEAFEKHEFVYDGVLESFVDEYDKTFDEKFMFYKGFLSLEVSLEQPKYRIKLPDSKFCLAYVINGDEEEFLPVVPCSLYVEQIIGSKDGEYIFKTEFTKQDFAEIKKLKTYEQFKELIKGDEK